MAANLLLSLISFDIPQMRSDLNYIEIFEPETGKLAAETEAFLQRVTTARALMKTRIQSMVSSDIYYAGLDLIPLLIRLKKSLLVQTTVSLAKPFVYSWSSGLDNQPRALVQSFFEPDFDLGYTISACACAAVNVARDSLKAGTEGMPSAARLLREASGLLQYNADSVLRRWQVYGSEASGYAKPAHNAPSISSGEVSLEAKAPALDFLAQFLLAQAQQLVVAKAIIGGNTPPLLISKLCVGGSNLYRDALSTLRVAGVTHSLHQSILAHLALFRRLLEAMSYKFLAISLAQNSTALGPGEAVAAARFARTYIQFRSEPSSIGLPTAHEYPQLAPLVSHIHTEIAAVQQLYETLDRDNNLVYYAPVPDTVDLPPPQLIVSPILPDAFSFNEEEDSYVVTFDV